MKVLVSLFALLFSALTHANPLNDIVMFGDSLSDTGNLYELYKIPSSPPYYLGRFSNGPVWIEALAESYFNENGKAHLKNYAFGGAAIVDDEDEIFSLKLEISKYLKIHQDKASENNLYVIWIGANNYLATPEDVEGTVAKVKAGIKDGVDTLAKAGAKHILLVNLPDLGVTPFPSQTYSKEKVPLIRKMLSSYTQRHNQALLETANEIKQSHPAIELHLFDAFAKFQEFLNEPERYGISNISEACFKSETENFKKNLMLKIASGIQERTEPGDCDDYLFFDGVHPTAKAHKIIAEQARAFLESEGVEFIG